MDESVDQMLGRKADWSTIYAALIHAIKTDSCIGCINNDQGHPAYTMGAIDGRVGWGDSPEDNALYKMLRDLADPYGRRHGTVITNWKSFCELVREGRQRSIERGEKDV